MAIKVIRTQAVRPDVGGLDLKVKRANKHISELHLAIEAFFATNPIGLVIEKNAQTGEDFYKVSRVSPVAPDISVIIGDVLQNLRSTLDHLVYRLVADAIAPKTPKRYVSFPIADSLKDYMSPEFRRKIELAGPEAVKRIDALKPYKGGNDLLWQLGELNNIDKHRLLLTAAMRYKHRRMTVDDYARVALQNPKAFQAGIWQLVKWTNYGGPTEPLKIGDVLYVKPPYLKLTKKMELQAEVAFNEPQIIKCESVTETLYIMLKLVENNILPRFADLL